MRRARSLATLQREAQRATRARGHRMAWCLYPCGTETVARPFGHGTCRDCSAVAVLDTRPAPNSIDIGGDALALDCARGRA